MCVALCYSLDNNSLRATDSNPHFNLAFLSPLVWNKYFFSYLIFLYIYLYTVITKCIKQCCKDNLLLIVYYVMHQMYCRFSIPKHSVQVNRELKCGLRGFSGRQRMLRETCDVPVSKESTCFGIFGVLLHLIPGIST